MFKSAIVVFTCLLAFQPAAGSAAGVLESLSAPLGFSDTRSQNGFEGFYLGFGLGRTSASSDYTEFNSISRRANGSTALHEDDSSSAMISIGHDWSVGNYVFGIEGRFIRRTLSDFDNQVYLGTPDTRYASSYESNTSRQIITRFGLIAENFGLIYVTGGLAKADYTQKIYDLQDNQEDVFSGTNDGKLIGVGFERILSNNLSIRGEFNRVTYDKTTHVIDISYGGQFGTYDTTENSFSVSLIRRF